MFNKLKAKWKVSGTRFILIMCVFAITGTTTAWMTRQITIWLDISKGSPEYWLLKLGVLLIGYWILILLIALPFGQFKFFWEYEKKVWRRMTGQTRRERKKAEESQKNQASQVQKSELS
jgi:hypothetical protein